MEERKPTVTARRLIAAAIALSFLVAMIAALSGDAMTWDGAALFAAALDTRDVTLPHARFALALFQAPAVWLSYFTSNVRLLALLYGLSYTLVPAVSAALSFRLLQGARPRLLVWQLAWSGAGVVAGQLFYVTECLIALHLVWPLLCIVATPWTRGRLALSTALATVLFGLHPVAAPLLVFAGSLSLAGAAQDGQRRTRVVAGAALLAAGFARAALALLDPYDSSPAVHFDALWQSLRLPAPGVAALAVSVTAVVALQIARGVLRRVAFLAGAAGLLATAVAFVPWARDETAWQDALNYRFVAPFAFVPFAFGAAHSILSRDREFDVAGAALGLGNVVLLAVVVTLQSAGWVRLRHALEAELARKPNHCFPMWAIPECSDTALRWWPTPAYALVLQGRVPRTLVLAGNDCKRADFGSKVQLNPWLLRPREGGWFDLRWAGTCEHCPPRR